MKSSCQIYPVTSVSPVVKDFGFRWPLATDHSYSYRKASIGSSPAARIAGTIPLTTPTTAKIPVATSRIIGDKISRMSPDSACFAIAL